MKKNDAFWSIVKAILLAVIALFLILNYWSSDQVEERLIKMQKKMDMMELKMENIHSAPAPSFEPKKETAEVDSPYPNIFVPDPFEDVTFPKMLGPNFKPYPLKFLATIGKPENLHPFSNWYMVSQAYSYCVGAAGKTKTGFYEIYSPFYATRIENRVAEDGKSGAYWVFLRKDLFWLPLKQSLFPDNIELAPQFLKSHPVTAHDFKFNFDTQMNPFSQEAAAVISRQQYDDVEKFEVVDDYTFYVQWRYKEVRPNEFKPKYRATLLTIGLSPLPTFVYQYFPDGTKIISDDSAPDAYRTNSSFAQQFTEHWAKNYIVSIGPYDFAGMNDNGMRFTRNGKYYDPISALYSEVEIAFRNSQDSIWNDFKLDNMSTYELPSYQIPEYERFLASPLYSGQKLKGRAVKRLDYEARTFSYIGWNEKTALFQSKVVRQALSYGINVDRIIHDFLNDQAVRIVGPISNQSTNINPNLKPIPYDPVKAKALLESDGWKHDGSGILKKVINGVETPFQFTINYFVKSTIGKAIVEFISTQLKEIGILCEPRGIEIADLSAKLDDKDFDAVMMAWVQSSPPEDPRQIWSSQGVGLKGSSNFISFSNARIDEIINLLDFEDDPAVRQKLYFEFQDIIFEEQPYTFLYSPITILLYREMVHNVFIPKDRQDLIPGAVVAEPLSNIFYERLPD